MAARRSQADIGDVLDRVETRLGRLERRGRGFVIPAVPTGGLLTSEASDDPPPPPDVIGSFWIDTNDGNKIYTWNGTVWVPTMDPAIDLTRDQAAAEIASWQDAAATADGLATLYRQAAPPTSHAVGDLWVDSDDNQLYRWNGSAWAPQSDTSLGELLADPALSSTVADGQVKTWWQFNPPTASGFGDIWVNTSTDPSTLYRWNNYDWVPVLDWSVALQQEQLQGKISTYYAPGPPTSTAVGDLWYDTSNQNHPYRAAGIGATTVGPGAWVSVQDETINAAAVAAADAAADAAAAHAAAVAAQADADAAIASAGTAQATADGKVRSFFQASPPTGMTSGDVGDLWFDTDDSNKMYTWTGATWALAADQRIAQAVTAAGVAQVTADGKITTFYAGFPAIPTSVSVGDLWIDTANQNKMYRAAAIGVNTIGAGAWVNVRDGSIAAASASAAAAQAAADAAMTAAQTAQATADGAIRTYYVATPPWANGSTGHANDAGDMWFDTDDGQAYRWDDTTKTWVVIEDNSIAAALAAAQNAQTTADGKITAWYQTSPPWTTGHATDAGDLWYDTDDKNKPYYWSGTAWVEIRDGTIADAQASANAAIAAANNAQTSADGKATTYFQTGVPWTNGTAGHALDNGDIWFDTDDFNRMYRWRDSDRTWVLSDDQRISPLITVVNGKITSFYQPEAPTATAIGDLWIDTDDGNHTYIWTGTVWSDARDDGINQAQDAANAAAAAAGSNASDIQTIQENGDNLEIILATIGDAAHAADGRIVVSDFEPQPSDADGKNEGSLWLTRTHATTNFVTNPSCEAGVSGWAGVGATLAQVAASVVVAGGYALEVTNSAGAAPHYAGFAGGTPGVPIEPGDSVAASGYLSLWAGSGAGCYAEIEFYAADGHTSLGAVAGAPLAIEIDDWARPYVIAVAPPLAAFVYAVRFYNPNAGDVWRMDGALVELSDELGRYFDGRSYDAEWTGAPDASTSVMTGGKVTRLFELFDSDWVRTYWGTDTISTVSASKITGGEMSGGLLTDNSVTVKKMSAEAVQASEALVAGDLVNVWNNNGIFQVRKASAATQREAHGFVLDPVASGGMVLVYYQGYDPFVTSLTPGTQFLSTTPGKSSAAPPTEAGNLVQRLGFAPNSATLDFTPALPVLVT